MSEFCSVVLWSCWVSMFWASQKKLKAKEPSCVMSEALTVQCIDWSIDYLYILLQHFNFRALQNFSWWKMQKWHYWVQFYTGNITAQCFVIHFDPQIPFGHSLRCCSYPLVLLDLGPIHDRGQISWGALLKRTLLWSAPEKLAGALCKISNCINSVSLILSQFRFVSFDAAGPILCGLCFGWNVLEEEGKWGRKLELR